MVFYASKNIGIFVDNGTFQLGINIINIQPCPAIIQILDIAYAFFSYYLILLKSSHRYLLMLTECPVFRIPCTETVRSSDISAINGALRTPDWWNRHHLPVCRRIHPGDQPALTGRGSLQRVPVIG